MERPVFGVNDRYIRRSGYRTSSPVIVRPISIRWISDVPSKMVKILECMGRVSGIPARASDRRAHGGTAALSGDAHGFQPHRSPPATHADGASSADEILGS